MGLTRRQVLAAAPALLLPKLIWTQSGNTPLLYWKLDDADDAAREAQSGTADAIPSRTGRAIWVGAGRNRALRLDGYSNWVQHATAPLPLSGSDITISAWIAIESYPVDTAAIVQLEAAPGQSIRLTLDKLGYLEFTAHSGEASITAKSTTAIPKATWVHLAATSGDRSIVLYLDGKPSVAATAPAHPLPRIPIGSATLGRAADCPIIAEVFPTGVLNGLIKDVRVFAKQLSAAEIIHVLSESLPDAAPDLQINGPWCAADPQRPLYHAMPPRAWTNEPHGLIHWEGQYHLFYQKNGNGPYWGHIHWGHMTSPDLYHWTEMPVALAPEPGVDSDGCWSGSVIEFEGKLAILYTAGDGHRSTICLATSTDGIHFNKHPGNPVIAAVPQEGNFPEFRDPHVWREGDTYYLIIGSAVNNVGGTALLYRSKDLVHWEFRKPLLVGDHETSGVFWEMPIFIHAGDYRALIVCEVPGRASYWVGALKDETFTPIHQEPRRLELFNHLLSPTPMFQDGQTITMGIIPDERSPKECWSAGWAHLYSLPRVLTADATGHLFQRPLEAIEHRSEPIASLTNLSLEDGKITPLEGISGTTLKLQIKLQRGKSQSVSLLLRRSADGRERTEIRYSWEFGRLVLDRSDSSIDMKVKRDMQETTYFPAVPDSLTLTVYLDKSVLEVFLDGRVAFATRIYPTLPDSDGVALISRGAGTIAESVTVATIKLSSQEQPA
jgi:sucrose-6-phosphate hydrolase SacC (GH32 family)